MAAPRRVRPQAARQRGDGPGREAFLGLVAEIDAALRLAGNAEVLG
ncbi:hypothetical protein WKI68_29065 [Streptomyces sp. MS1.HAVA.3]|uniref:Uncharacterized protein n=1 Tax=Streptomyces caledonius TaxID=3134107 RepID=A0ABU8U8T0_9ACTN